VTQRIDNVNQNLYKRGNHTVVVHLETPLEIQDQMFRACWANIGGLKLAKNSKPAQKIDVDNHAYLRYLSINRCRLI
jgi:hypothetical protein